MMCSWFLNLSRLFVPLAAALALGMAHAEADPPGRVARLDYFDGSVTFAPAGSEDWAYATPNRPMTTGDRLWVDQGGRAELHVGSTGLRLNSKTSLDVSTLDDNTLQLKEAQGNVDLHVRKLWDGQTVEIDTPNLAFVVRKPGVYRIDVDPTANTTLVSVRHGDAEIYDSNQESRRMGSGQAMLFSGNQIDSGQALALPASDGFDRWVAERDHREEDSVSSRYVSREMIGYQDLDEHGSWRDVDGYGSVWVPTVTVVNWAPYRYGHWAWVAPWGWTWVDDAPWGFAPFHYGRWAYIGSYWAWVPGPVIARPVYAPALVAFAGGGSGGFHWGISLSIGSPGVAWFPLAPGEIYRPAYTVSPTYITNINHTVNVNNTTIVNNTTVINNKTVYVNQNVPNAVTAVPAHAFVKGLPVQQANTPVNAAALKTAQMTSSPAIAPVSQSLIGGAAKAPSSAAPPMHIVARNVVSTRPAATPPALNDALAHQYIAQGHTVEGAGPLPTHLLAPIAVHTNGPATPPAAPAAVQPPPANTAKAGPPSLPASNVPHPPGLPVHANQPQVGAPHPATPNSPHMSGSAMSPSAPAATSPASANAGTGPQSPTNVPHPPALPSRTGEPSEPNHPFVVHAPTVAPAPHMPENHVVRNEGEHAPLPQPVPTPRAPRNVAAPQPSWSAPPQAPHNAERAPAAPIAQPRPMPEPRQMPEPRPMAAPRQEPAHPNNPHNHDEDEKHKH